ncbi:MAG: hypothetical protein IJ879_04075 [Muribaculaceae bacterium]|nr:hypothetical protein [Muribaculaceae bacterium]
MSEKVNSASKTSKKAGKGIIQGRLFSLEFFKRYWFYVVFVVAMALAYIANKFLFQSSMQEVMKLKVELDDSRTDLVKSSAAYNSMIRESEMTRLMQERHLGLSTPDEPPYELKSK